MSKDPAVDGLLLERAIPALDDPVGFGLFAVGAAGEGRPAVPVDGSRFLTPDQLQSAAELLDCGNRRQRVATIFALVVIFFEIPQR